MIKARDLLFENEQSKSPVIVNLEHDLLERLPKIQFVPVSKFIDHTEHKKKHPQKKRKTEKKSKILKNIRQLF